MSKESPREESVPRWWEQSSFITPTWEGKRGEPYVNQKKRACPAWRELPDVSETQGTGRWPTPGVTGRIKAHLTLFPLLLAFIIGQSQLEARWQGNPLMDSSKWPSEAKRRVRVDLGGSVEHPQCKGHWPGLIRYSYSYLIFIDLSSKILYNDNYFSLIIQSLLWVTL